MARFNARTGDKLQLRMGLNSGAVVAGMSASGKRAEPKASRPEGRLILRPEWAPRHTERSGKPIDHAVGVACRPPLVAAASSYSCEMSLLV